VNVMLMFRFKANGQLLNVIEVTEYSSGTYHCVVIDKNDQTHTADVKLGKYQLYSVLIAFCHLSVRDKCLLCLLWTIVT